MAIQSARNMAKMKLNYEVLNYKLFMGKSSGKWIHLMSASCNNHYVSPLIKRHLGSRSTQSPSHNIRTASESPLWKYLILCRLTLSKKS